MKKDIVNNIFKDLQGSFDIEAPNEGHENRFLEKLNTKTNIVPIKTKKKTYWKPVSIAASIFFLCAIGIGIYTNTNTINEQVAKIAPEVSKTEFYFANLIEEQVQQLQNKSTPETEQIIEDTMLQLQKLEMNYKKIEQDLINGGNSKLILSAMIKNFQTRIDLLQDVLDKMETTKKYTHENII